MEKQGFNLCFSFNLLEVFMNFVNDVKFKYTKTKKQQAEKIANWFVKNVLSLKDDELLDFYNLIYDELIKRGVLKDVRGC